MSRPKESKNVNPAKEKRISCRVTKEEFAWCSRLGCISRYVKTLIRLDIEESKNNKVVKE